MDRWIVYHGLFGGWGWERLNAEGEVTAESVWQFDDRAECVADAAACGFDLQCENAVQHSLRATASA